MLHLLPEEYRDSIRKVYTQRFLILVLWMVFSVGVVCFVSLIPAYVLIHLEKQDIENKLSKIDTNASLELVSLETFSKDIDAKLVYVESGDRVLDLVNRILSIRNQGIVFNLVSVDGLVVTIGGVSDTRNSLSIFNKNLKSEEWVESVSLPLQVFTEEKNISFNAIITVKENAE